MRNNFTVIDNRYVNRCTVTYSDDILHVPIHIPVRCCACRYFKAIHNMYYIFTNDSCTLMSQSDTLILRNKLSARLINNMHLFNHYITVNYIIYYITLF